MIPMLEYKLTASEAVLFNVIMKNEIANRE